MHHQIFLRAFRMLKIFIAHSARVIAFFLNFAAHSARFIAFFQKAAAFFPNFRRKKVMALVMIIEQPSGAKGYNFARYSVTPVACKLCRQAQRVI